MVYKGYIDTSLGSELVAVKTGKGSYKELCRLRLCEEMACVYIYPLICSPIFLW